MKPTISFNFWLAFSASGSMPRVTKNAPALAPSERAMHCVVDLPRSLFMQPTLRAKITIDEGQAQPPEIDVRALETAVENVIGGTVRFEIEHPKEGEE